MHILINTYGYPTKETKGNPFVKELAEALSNQGVKVSIILFTFTSALNFLKSILLLRSLTNWQKAPGVTLVNSYYVNFIPGSQIKMQKRLILFSAAMRLRLYILLNGKPDLIQHHYIINAQPWIIDYLSKKFDIPYVLFEHSPIKSLDGIVEKKLHPYFTYQELLSFVKGAKARIARSSAFQKAYENVFKEEFLVIPSLVSEQFGKKPLPEFPKSQTPFYFLAIGSLLPKKQHERLIRAFAIKFKGDSDIFLNVAGDGFLKDELNEIIQELGLEKQVQLTGLLSRKEVFELIDKSHVIVVSSDVETFGNTITEGLFRGLPAVATRCGGPEDIINNENGLLCDKRENDLAEKMGEIYKNYDSYDPVKIIRDAKSQYSEKAVCAKILSLYSSFTN